MSHVSCLMSHVSCLMNQTHTKTFFCFFCFFVFYCFRLRTFFSFISPSPSLSIMFNASVKACLALLERERENLIDCFIICHFVCMCIKSKYISQILPEFDSNITLNSDDYHVSCLYRIHIRLHISDHIGYISDLYGLISYAYILYRIHRPISDIYRIYMVPYRMHIYYIGSILDYIYLIISGIYQTYIGYIWSHIVCIYTISDPY